MTTTVQPPVLPTPTSAPRRVSTAGYWIGSLITAAAVIGAICWALVAFLDYQHTLDRYPRMTVPGFATVQVNDTATRVLYYESPRGTTTPALIDLALTVTGPSGTTVPVTAYGHDIRYDVPRYDGHLVPHYDGRIGHAVAQFHPDQAGVYQIRSAATAGVTGTVAIGRDFVWDVLPHAIGAGALFLLGGAAGVSLIVVTGVRRGNARRHPSA